MAVSVKISFPGVSREEARQVLRELADIADALGFTVPIGAGRERGSVGRLLVAIARGEAEVFRVADWRPSWRRNGD